VLSKAVCRWLAYSNVADNLHIKICNTTNITHDAAVGFIFFSSYSGLELTSLRNSISIDQNWWSCTRTNSLHCADCTSVYRRTNDQALKSPRLINPAGIPRCKARYTNYSKVQGYIHGHRLLIITHFIQFIFGNIWRELYFISLGTLTFVYSLKTERLAIVPCLAPWCITPCGMEQMTRW